MKNLDDSETPLQTIDNLKSREVFVQNLNGTTMEEVVLFCSQVPLVIFVTIVIEIVFMRKLSIDLYKSHTLRPLNAIAIFLLETVTIILPVICMLTLLSDYLHLNLLVIVISIQFIIIHTVSSANGDILYWNLSYYKRGLASDYLNSSKQAFVTYFRSFVFLVTSVSILAVDFNVFPRRFAKTEMYGVSLMDLGVGLFIISNSLVTKTNDILFSRSLKKVILETAVYLLLGLARYVLIQRLDYQKHVTEYGMHWNFFITLGLVKILSHIILKISRGHSLFVGLLVMAFHQYLLTNSLEKYVFSDIERESWVMANREGIVSLLGYLSLHLIGISIGNIVSSIKDQPIASKVKLLIAFILVSVGLYFVTFYVNNTQFKISRRLANLPYIVWVLAISFFLLSISLIMELLILCFIPIKSNLRSDVYPLITPIILQGINYNGLLFFITSNLLTGLVNLYTDVLGCNTLKTMLILIVYMVVNCIIVFILYMKNIKLQIW